MMDLVDRTGERHGFLVVQGMLSARESLCLCDCGQTVKVLTTNLLTGNTRSCGCLRQRVASQRTQKDPRYTLTHQVWLYYIRNATTRGIPWELTKAQFAELIFGPCHYCGILGGTTTSRPRKYGKVCSMENNGVDRKDNAMGYTAANCVSACKTCNLAKNNMPVGDFIEWVRRVYAHTSNIK